MQIIPALYIHNGKAASYQPGDHLSVRYLDQSPYDLIDLLGKHDVQRIFLLDIEAAQDPLQNNKGLIGSLANVAIPDLEVGGGINDLAYLKSLQYAGVDYFVLGSALFTNPGFFRDICHAPEVKNSSIMVSFDLKDGQLYTLGWTEPITDKHLHDLIGQCLDEGVHRFIITHIDSQHPEKGPAVDFYSELVKTFPGATFAAAGHIHLFDDIDALKSAGVQEVIVGDDWYTREDQMDLISAYNRQETE